MSQLSPLEALITEVIQKYHEVEATGQEAEVIHLDVLNLKVQPAVRLEGRNGFFQKVDFEYDLKYLASNALEEDDIVHYRQSMRLNESGQITAVSDPTEVWE